MFLYNHYLFFGEIDMKKKLLVSISTVALGVGAIALSLFAFNSNGLLTKTSADGSKTATLNSDQLKAITLSDYRHPNKTYDDDEHLDKKFSIPLAGGKYISGAVIFRDCGLQYSGSNLGSAFGINNTENRYNAYNFNIYFSVEKFVSLTATIDLNSTSSTNYVLEVKSGEIDTGDFYIALGNQTYDNLKKLANDSDIFALSDSAYVNGTINSSYQQPVEVTSSFTTEKTIPLNIVGLQFTYVQEQICDPNSSIDFTIKSLSISYNCL